MTSLPPDAAGPQDLLALWRGHWLIENKLHWRRDVILREDASRLRCGAAPQAMAALRNTILALTHKLNGPLAEIRQSFAEDRANAIQTVKNGVL